MWYLGDELWKYEGTGDPPGYFGSCDIASNIPGQPRGLAKNDGFSGGEVIIHGRDVVAETSNFYVYDYSSCSQDNIATFSGAGTNRGMAPHESNTDHVYVINGNQNEIVELDLANGDYVSRLDIPGGKQRGLDIKQWPDGTVWFIISYDGGNGEEEIQIIEKSSRDVVRTFTSGNGESYAALWNDHPNEQRIFTTDSNNELTGVTPVNLWAGDGEGKARYERTLTNDSEITNHDLKGISWSGEAPSAFKGSSGRIELQAENKNGKWETLDSYGAGYGSFSNTVNLGSDYDFVESIDYRVVLTDNYKIRGGSANPKVTDVSWDYEYYDDSGTVSSTTVNAGSVQSFENLTFNGTPGGEDIDVTVLDKNGNVEYSKTGVKPNATLDLSSVSADYSTENVEVLFDLSTGGFRTPKLSGYDLNYQSYVEPPPNITSSSATVADRETTETQVQTVIGSKDTYTIENVNQTVGEVRWYVDDTLVKNESVSESGPYSYTHTFEKAGDHTVVGVVENTTSNTVDDQQWDVTSNKVAIQGKGSYSTSSQFFTTTQTFKAVSDDSIEYRLEYNESIVELTSGKESGTVTSGGSVTWDFSVKQENYTGQPITVVASYGGTEVKKPITVSSVRSSGFILGSGDSLTFFTNTWSSFLPFGDDPGVYILIQGILGTGLFAALWLHHLGIAWLPDVIFVKRLYELPFWTKLLVSIDGALLITGLGLVPWGVLLVGLSGVIWWRWLRGGFSLTRVVSSI
ncbi:YncE family protein [Halomicroarcula sp. GCM10025894]